MCHFLLFQNSRETPLVGVVLEIVFLPFDVCQVEDARLGGLESVKQAYGMLSAFCTCVGSHDH